MDRPERLLHFEKCLDLPVSAQVAFDWHARPGAFERLTPPWLETRIVEDSNGIETGSRLVFEVKKGPAWIRWVAEHRDTVQGERFTDIQISGPFAYWRHVHRFEPTSTGCRLRDQIRFALPFSWLSHPLAGWFVRRDLERLFTFRHQATLAALASPEASEVALSDESGHNPPRKRP